MIFFIVSVPRQCVVPDVFVVGHLVGDGAAVVEGHAAVVGAISAVLRVRHGCASRGRRRTRLRTAPPLAPSDARCLWAYSNNTNRCTGRHSTLIPIFCWHQNKSSPAWWAATLATYCPHMPSQLSIRCQQNIGIKVLCRTVQEATATNCCPYSGFHPLCRKNLKIRICKLPPAGGPKL